MGKGKVAPDISSPLFSQWTADMRYIISPVLLFLIFGGFAQRSKAIYCVVETRCAPQLRRRAVTIGDLALYRVGLLDGDKGVSVRGWRRDYFGGPLRMGRNSWPLSP